MDIELRPLRLAEILDRIFQLYRARFALFLGIAGISTILELLWNLINMAEVRWMIRHQLARQWATTVSTIPAWAILFATAALCLAATNRAVAAIYDGARRTEAARIGGVTLQIVRDWVMKFNAAGSDGLLDRKAPGSTEWSSRSAGLRPSAPRPLRRRQARRNT